MKKTLKTSFAIKAVDPEQRTICGYAAVHGNVDRVGDVIDPTASRHAVARLRSVSDVGVFISHNMQGLPVGVPTKIVADERGLYTETYVFDGPEGDNLLAVASGLAKFGKSLGMSIGYYPKQITPERRGDRLVRRLMDYDLNEFSFASAQITANPDALVVAVKTSGGTMYELKVIDGKHCIVQGDTVLAEYDTPELAMVVLGDLYAGKALTLNDLPEELRERAERMRARKETDGGDEKAEWSTAYTNALPDSHFLYVESGEKDDNGMTVPRTKRHFPYRDKDGEVDVPHLRNAIARIPQSSALGEDAKRALQTRARRMLERANAGSKTLQDIDADEWKTGVALNLRAVAYEMLDLSDEVIAKQNAMQLLGQDVKARTRAPLEVREHVRTIITSLGEMVKSIEDADRDDDPRAELEWWERWVEFNPPVEVGAA